MKAVLTGGRGSGKTSLLQALSADSTLSTVPDPAWAMVERELQVASDLLPWRDNLRFSLKLLEMRIQQFMEAGDPRKTFVFDRGIPDGIAFLEADGIAPPLDLLEAANKYRYDAVFWLPPWQAIYKNEPERPESWDTSRKVGLSLRAVYTRLGYQPIEVPLAPVAERARLVLFQLSSMASSS